MDVYKGKKFWSLFFHGKNGNSLTKNAFHNRMNPDDLKRLVTVAMPFGKYKGRVIADLPGYYLNWFVQEGVPNGELGRLLVLMQEIDHNGLKPLLDPLRKGASARP